MNLITTIEQGVIFLEKRRLRKVIAILLAFFISLSMIWFPGKSDVNAEGKRVLILRASEINAKGGEYSPTYSSWRIFNGKLEITGDSYDYSIPQYSLCKLILDEDLELSHLYCTIDLTISSEGSHTLSLTDNGTYDAEIYVVSWGKYSELIIDKGVNINIKSSQEYGGILCQGDIFIKGATITYDAPNSGLGIGAQLGNIECSDGSYIKTPEDYKIDNVPQPYEGNKEKATIVNGDGTIATNVVVAVREDEPDDKGEEKDKGNKKDKDDKSNNGNKDKQKSGDSGFENEWIGGFWYDAQGNQTYKYIGSWRKNSRGWWFEDSNGWYPHSQWQKIDKKWYFFDAEGYMSYSEYRDGCWLGSDGAWVENYGKGKWHRNKHGWWYQDGDWYPVSQTVWIDGVKSHFDSDGYFNY